MSTPSHVAQWSASVASSRGTWAFPVPPGSNPGPCEWPVGDVTCGGRSHQACFLGHFLLHSQPPPKSQQGAAYRFTGQFSLTVIWRIFVFNCGPLFLVSTGAFGGCCSRVCSRVRLSARPLSQHKTAPLLCSPWLGWVG